MARRVVAKKQLTGVVSDTNRKFNSSKINTKDLGCGDHSSQSPNCAHDDDDENFPNAFSNQHLTNKNSLKRKSFEIENADLEQEQEKEGDFTSEMTNFLEGFGTVMNRNLQTKQRRLEQLTQESIRSTSRLVSEATSAQAERAKLHDEFKKQIFNFLQQGEQDNEKSRETEEKLNKALQQLSRHQQQMRIAQGQRLKALRQICEHYFGGVDTLNSKHGGQFESIQADLRKEMALLQKRILMDTQQQEMMNVKKSLKNMFV